MARRCTTEVFADAESIPVVMRGSNRSSNIPEVEVEIILNCCSRTSDARADPNAPYTEFRPTYYRRRNIGRVLLDPARYLAASKELLSSTAPHLIRAGPRSLLEHSVAELLQEKVQGAAAGSSGGLRKALVQIEAEVRTTYWTDPSGLEERDDTCAVCLERFQQQQEEEKKCVRIACSHKFHVDCLQQWTAKTCPLCRYEI